MRSTRLQPVDDAPAENFSLAPPEPAAPRTVTVAERQITDLLIKGIGQRAITIISTLFTLLLAASAWWLWWSALPQPTPTQLIGLGMYSVFVLALEYVRRR